jgi:hypothetical protein
MKEKLQEIIELASKKYGKDHELTVHVAQVLTPYLKLNKYGKVVEDSLDVNVDELLSLLKPERFDFQRQKIGDIEVSDEV